MTTFLPDKSVLDPNDSPPSSIYIRLTNEAVNSILASQGKNVKLSLGPKVELKVDDKSYSTSSVSEACPIDLYQKEKQNINHYKNIGNITHRITVQKSLSDDEYYYNSIKSQTKSLQKEKEANKTTLLGGSGGSKSLPGSPSLSSPASKHRTLQISASKSLLSQALSSGPNRVVHLLALGKNTLKNICQRTNLSHEDVEGILEQYGKKVDADYYVLSDSKYKELRIWEWKHYSNEERKKVINDSKAAFDRLNLPSDHSARKNLIDPKSRQQQHTSSSVPPPSPPKGSNNNAAKATTASRPGAILKTNSNNKKASSKPSTPTVSSPSTGATKRKTSPAENSTAASTAPKKQKARSTVDDDLFELARKFRQTYDEYAKLYNRVSSSAERKKSKADVQKLLSMHRELESWKNKLWSLAPNNNNTNTTKSSSLV